MDYEMTSILEIIAEMNSFSIIDDDLSTLISQFDDGALGEDDLSMVSASYSPLPFSEFLKKKR